MSDARCVYPACMGHTIPGCQGPCGKPFFDPMPLQDTQLPPPVGYISREEHAKLVAEAEARGMERAANMVALAPLAYLPHSPGAVAFFADPTATLNDAAAAIRAAAAAHRKDEETPT